MTSEYKRRRAQEMAARNFRKHGLSGHPMYEVWRGILRRCHDESSHAYARYGGRGITIDPMWMHLPTFIYLVELEIGPRPSLKHSLDRINNGLGYMHLNIRWATDEEQAQNRRPRSRGRRGHDRQVDDRDDCLCDYDCAEIRDCPWNDVLAHELAELGTS